MAKRRKNNKSNKNSYNNRKKNKSAKIDLAVVGTIVLSILLAVLIYTESGYIGKYLSEAVGGMMGILKYILPIGAFAIAIKIACKNNEYLTIRLLQYALFLLCIAVVMSVYQISSGNLNANNELSQIIKDGYELGTKNIGGGALGTLAAIPLVTLLGNFGAVILSVGISIMLFVFIFGIELSRVINEKVEDMQEKREERVKNRYLEAENISEQRRKRKEEKKLLKMQEMEKQKEVNQEQIRINLNGKLLDSTAGEGGLKKYKYDADDLMPLGMEQKSNGIKKLDLKSDKKQELEPNTDYIENNLFKQEEEKKEDKTKEVLQLEHAVVVEDEHYEYPPYSLLSKGSKKGLKGGTRALTDTATKLQKTLYSFGVSAKVEDVSVGPTITRYELKPAEGVRVSKIANLADDIALNLAAETIRIEAPIPGKQAVGIEVPNKEKEAVHFREVIESDEFQDNDSKLSVALGKDVAGKTIIADIAKMPHVLIAGSTGSGKSVCINTIIASFIYNAKPSEVKLVMIDPKVVELSVYNGIPHLLIPVVTDPKKAAGALAWAVQEMDDRYNKFAQKGVRDLKGYNQVIEKEDGIGKLPQIVIIVDELADLMMVAAKDVEDAICRLAQKARAAGMHLIIATQRPSVDVITGLIKANVPSRIAFAVSSQVDSRTILDSVGAEKLLGKGDMLFYPAGAPKPVRAQGAFVTDGEVEKIVDFIKSNGTATYSEDILESIENSNKSDKELKEEQASGDDADPFLMDAIDIVVETGQASTSFIQRRFKVGYARAGRIIDQMEERGVISGYQGSKPRQVLMTPDQLKELKMAPNSLPEEE